MAILQCLVRKIPVEGPEEEVRQEYLRELVNDYGYPLDHIDVEVPITDGSSEVVDVDTGKPKRADIVIYRSAAKINDQIMVIVECKKPDEGSGERQLKSYGNRTTAEILVWHNGTLPTSYWQRQEKPRGWIVKPWLPRFGQDYGSKIIKKNELKPARNLVSIFNRIHNDI